MKVMANPTTNWRKLAEDNADIVAGWCLSVTMQTRTPLKWLLRHGEFRAGADAVLDEVPEQHGIWVPVTKSWEDLGVDIPELPPTTMASEVGPIPEDGGDFLVFLIEYRKIVEAELSEEYQADALKALASIFSQYAQTIDRHRARKPKSRRSAENR